MKGEVYHGILHGFRPLAGFWFLNDFLYAERDAREMVSVPLRGSGS